MLRGPLVSVIINCYNGEKYLKETLDSVFEQTYNNYEIIFWDNCSTDKTSEIVQAFHNKKLRYFRGDINVPLGKARNYALEKADGEYIAFLDSDDLWEPDKLEKQLAIFDKDSSIGLVATNFKRYNMLSGKVDVFYSVINDRVYDFCAFVCEYNFGLSTCMIKKSALQGLLYYFDEKLSYVEEYELFIRIAYNWNMYCMAEPLATYRIHPDMNTIRLRPYMKHEYECVLHNLLEMVPNIGGEYPRVIEQLEYMGAFAMAKYLLAEGKNADVRDLMKPYRNRDIRSCLYYYVACFPRWISRRLQAAFYKKRI